ncbi:MAG: Crp/Fnr family transcriptional regulator [Desulfitobacterium hafniense]|nr:Crp/Fnr family transcriptional regulator [Desulfitobacterium hafniense]
MNEQKFLQELKKNPLWGNIPEDFTSFCISYGRIRKYSSKQYLYFSGDEANSVFFLLKGRVQLVLTNEFSEKVIRILEPVSFFPEIVLDGKMYPHAALTMDSTEVLALDRQAFLRYLEKNPSFIWIFYKLMALDLRRAYRQIKNLSIGDARLRLGAKLFSLAHAHGRDGTNGIEITIPLSATDLASMCSLARESVSRILSELKDAGIIQVNKKTIIISSKEKLRQWIIERSN